MHLTTEALIKAIEKSRNPKKRWGVNVHDKWIDADKLLANLRELEEEKKGKGKKV